MSTMNASTRIYIRDLRPSERFQGVFALMNAQRGMTKTGKPYLKALLRDKTGELPARMWSAPEQLFARLGTEGFVWVEGETQPYQGELQLIVHTIDPLEPTPEQLRELLPCTEKNIDEMFNEVRSILGSLKHPAALALAQAYLDDEMLMDHFRAAPAARALHHAYLGGLLEHTLQLLKVADAILPLYPRMSRDIVLLGLFLHDLGKTRELRWETGFHYTDRGELVGHIVEGAIMLHDKAQQAMTQSGVRMPGAFITVLQHIILSHHGVPEYGAARIPATPEAIFVSMLDNLDAKTTMALASARPEIERDFDMGGNFTEKHWGLGTKLFRPDPLG
jgi:3'-5' exoribonuclease